MCNTRRHVIIWIWNVIQKALESPFELQIEDIEISHSFIDFKI